MYYNKMYLKKGLPMCKDDFYPQTETPEYDFGLFAPIANLHAEQAKRESFHNEDTTIQTNSEVNRVLALLLNGDILSQREISERTGIVRANIPDRLQRLHERGHRVLCVGKKYDTKTKRTVSVWRLE